MKSDIEKFIPTYIKDVSDVTDTPKIYIKFSALHLTSSIFSRFFIIPDIAMQCKPNIMVVLASIPGRTRRSTLTSFDNQIYENVYGDLLNKIKTISKDNLDEMVSNSIFEEGSPEGIFDGMIKYRKELLNTPFLRSPRYKNTLNIDFQSPEFGEIIKNIGSRSAYQRGMGSLISRSYYGEGGKVSLSTRGGKDIRYLPRGIYATMFAGMQTANLYIDPYHVSQGLLRRIILINADANRHLPFLDAERQRKQEYIDTASNLLIKKLDTVMNKFEHIDPGFTHIPVFFAPEVKKKINEVDVERTKDIDSDNENYYFLVRQSDGEHLSKLSSLVAIDDLSFYGPGLFVRTEHYNLSKKYFDEATCNNYEIFENIGVKNLPPESDKEGLNKVLRIIKRYPGGVNKSTVTKMSNMVVKKLDPILDTLEDSKRIIKKTTLVKGHETTLYYPNK